MSPARFTAFLLGILVVMASGFILHQLQVVFKPLLIAIFLSFIFDPMVGFFRKLKMPSFLAYLVALIVVFWSFYLIGLVVYASFANLAQRIPQYQDQFNELYRNLLGSLKIPHEAVQAYIDQIRFQDVWKELSIPSLIRSTLGNFLNFLGKLFLVLLFTVYIVLGKRHYLSKVGKAFSKQRGVQINRIIHNIDIGMQKYLGIKTLVSLVTGVIATVILLIFNVEFALLWGLLTFLLNYIPQIGSAAATIPPILLCIFQHGSIIPALWVAILLLTTQMTMGNIVEPRLMGSSLHMSPLVVILSLIFWGFIWGPAGMVLAVPISASIQIICSNIDSLRPISLFMGGD